MTARPRRGGLGLTTARALRTITEHRHPLSRGPLPRRRGSVDVAAEIEDSHERCRALVALLLGVEAGVLDRTDHALELDDKQWSRRSSTPCLPLGESAGLGVAAMEVAGRGAGRLGACSR
jgi:hypothetical protein